jgi:hypothetical protein
VTLDFQRLVRFDLPSKAWQAPAAVLECLEEHLLQTFCVLSTDLAERLAFPGRNPTAKEVLDSLGQWEALLRGQQHLSEAGEVGLWGELRFLESLPDVDYGIRAWRGPEGFITDFFGGGVGVECKASRTRLRHHISHDQVGRGRDFPVFVVSMWVGTDGGVPIRVEKRNGAFFRKDEHPTPAVLADGLRRNTPWASIPAGKGLRVTRGAAPWER